MKMNESNEKSRKQQLYIPFRQRWFVIKILYGSMRWRFCLYEIVYKSNDKFNLYFVKTINSRICKKVIKVFQCNFFVATTILFRMLRSHLSLARGQFLFTVIGFHLLCFLMARFSITEKVHSL